MEVLCVLSTVSQGKRVKLDPEGDALLAAVLPGGELCADAVHLQTGARVHQNALHTFEVENHGCAQQMAQKRAAVCGWVTCTKTEVLLFMSHRNSAALSWEG